MELLRELNRICSWLFLFDLLYISIYIVNNVFYFGPHSEERRRISVFLDYFGPRTLMESDIKTDNYIFIACHSSQVTHTQRPLVRSKDYQIIWILAQFFFIALIQGHPVQGSTRYDLKVKMNLQRFCYKIFLTPKASVYAKL